jgi:hypothetical protein
MAENGKVRVFYSNDFKNEFIAGNPDRRKLTTNEIMKYRRKHK